MKRVLTVILAALLFGGLNLQAAPVSKSRALDIAKKIFASQTATKAAGDVKLLWDGEDIATKSTLDPAFYVFGRDNGGFVIIAGDDNVTPVLAISDHNDFRVEGMPDNVKWWMDRMKAYVRSTKTQAPSVREQWSRFIATKEGAVITGEVTNKIEHLTPAWDQGNNDEYYFGAGNLVFNRYCPFDLVNTSSRSVTGCVATALGEVLTTMSGIYGAKLPTIATVSQVEPYSIPAKYASYQFASAAPTSPYLLNTTYDWNNLRTLTDIEAIRTAVKAGNTDLLDNLGNLMADLGAMMHAMYSSADVGRYGTSAITSQAPDTLAKYMGMNKSAYYDQAAFYTTEHWVLKLKAELYKHPIIYSGRSADNVNGHAFVFDGYGKFEGDDVFRVNFGWGGSCNGYYVETNLATKDDPDDEHYTNYAFYSGAIFDFYPDPDSPQYETVISLVPWDASEHGLSVSTTPIEKDQYFDLSYNTVKNIGRKPFVGTIRATLVHKDNTKDALATITVRDNEHAIAPNSGFSGYYPIKISALTFGDRIILEYSTDGENYKKVDTPFDSNFATMITEVPIEPVPFIDTKASYTQNDFFEFRLKNHGCDFADTQWKITDPDGTPVTKPQSDGMFQLTKAGAYKIEAAIAPAGGAVVETVVAYINVVAP